MFVINFKNYEEIAGENAVRLTKIATEVAKKYEITIAVCPPQHLLSEISKISSNVFAQHLDNSKIGSTTGFVIPEIVKKSNAKGSLINHSEHRISPKEIEDLVNRLRNLGMISIVCVQDVKEAQMYAKLNPNYIAIEPPELIGSGKAVSKEKPEIITESVQAVKEANNSTQLLCGAGIVSGEDVSQALKLGAKGILVASGIVKSTDWQKSIEEFAVEFTKK